jgi:hypothetical protein
MLPRFAYDTGWRSIAHPDGITLQVKLPWCCCTPPVGPLGGVCGTCGGAIYQPPDGEQAVTAGTEEPS